MSKVADHLQIVELMEAQREKYAKEVMGYDEVKAQMISAAKQGLPYIRISQTRPITLRGTKAAKLLTTYLKTAGYIVEWVTTVQREISNRQETGAFIEYSELRILWGHIKFNSGPEIDRI